MPGLSPLESGRAEDLTAWNIEDLQAYIANMTAEIARCEKIIEEKKSLSSAADALFKK